METFPKIVTSFPQKDESMFESQEGQSTYVNCNICRNFSNILNPNHRRSKDHQKKMTVKLRATRVKVKKLGLNSVSVHDEDWGKNDSWYCYFCDKSLKKHEVNSGLMIETLGYMSHLASPEHVKAVKFYLKYHVRNEEFEVFCKTEAQLKKFMEKIPEAKETYLKKMEIINMQDVQAIRNIEEQRKKLVEEATQTSMISSTEINAIAQPSHSSDAVPYAAQACNNPSNEQIKLPPWQVEEVQSSKQISSAPVIGPTMDTLIQHVANQKKKKLPVKRLGANFKRTRDPSAKWFPTFKGVWNKGKRNQSKSRRNENF